MIKLGDLFEIETGKDLILRNVIEGNYPIIGHSVENNGIVRHSKFLETHKLYKKGSITLADRGNFWATVQPNDFYIGTRVKVLIPKREFTLEEKIYYCLCINANKYRFNYGRNSTSGTPNLLVPHPDNIPQWVYEANIPDYSHIPLPYSEEKTPELKVEEWKEFRLDDLFDIEVGKGPSSKFANENPGGVPFISATANNNGVTTFTSYEATHKENTITVSRNGSIGESFYQNKPFCATADVGVLNPKFNNNQYISLFITVILREEKYKYNYGRKWNSERMNNTVIKLPADIEGNPDWKWMENYVKTLKFSKEV